MNAPRRVLITGGASGLGAAVVNAVATAGGIRLVLDLRVPAQAVPYLTVDLADTRAAERTAAALAEQAGGLEAVVTAAGLDIRGSLEDVPAADWERVIGVNLLIRSYGWFGCRDRRWPALSRRAMRRFVTTCAG